MTPTKPNEQARLNAFMAFLFIVCIILILFLAGRVNYLEERNENLESELTKSDYALQDISSKYKMLINERLK